MTQATTPASVGSQTIAVEHIKISSSRSFAEVRRKLESTVPKLDIGIAEALRNGDQKRAKDYADNGPKLSIFHQRDHGAFESIASVPTCPQYVRLARNFGNDPGARFRRCGRPIRRARTMSALASAALI